MTWRSRKPLTVVVAVLTLGACTEITYVGHKEPLTLTHKPETEPSFGRQVHYHLARAFHSGPPNCVMVLPTKVKTQAEGVGKVIDDAVSRHLTNRFDRVIGGRKVAYKLRTLAMDPAHKDDRRHLGRALRCEAVMETETAGVESFYAVVWADLSVRIRLTLRRANDGEVLWRGEHTASRSDGGLPISLVSLPVGAFSAGKLAGDKDALPSMVDDTVRRIMRSLPDVRRY